MSLALTEQDYERIGSIMEDVFDRKIESARQAIREDTEELLAEHHESLTRAISEVILSDKLKSLESEMGRLQSRVEVLEAR